jgi:outer membrane lipoprotein SlyB
MKNLNNQKTLLLVCLCVAVPSWADDVNKTDAVIGAGVGAAVGAVIGDELGDRKGAIVGSAVGAAIGTAIATESNSHGGRTIVIEANPQPVIIVQQSKKKHHCPPGQAKKGRC